MIIKDIHTHHQAPQSEAVVSKGIDDFNPIEGQLYSVGFHPWETATNVMMDKQKFKDIASFSCVAAIGECGIDRLKGAPLFRQMQIFRYHIEISEKLKKPLVIHDVKAHDIIFGLYRDLKPEQKWVIHGFRAKPSVAKMMSDTGIYLSFGEFFNPETVKAVPENLILAETDESLLSINEIIEKISGAKGEEMTEKIIENTRTFLGL